MIEILSPETIQKIAAGEVVERPGSIVKELVENSIDAKANSITVEIKDGGKTSIRVVDNGIGIEKDDLLKAFQRHATSKLKEFDELYEIYSLGFRGEALASVIAAADVIIKTKTDKDNTGASLEIVDGKFSEIHPIAMNTGTVLEIKNLFDNIPVRKKFLRKDSTEANVITNMMYRFAISNKNISFKYIKDNRIVFETIRGNLRDILKELFDSSLVDNLVDIEIENKNYSLSGLASNNNYYRGNRGLQYLFINGRFVENKEIQRAIEDQYTSIIPNGKYPVFQLFLEISPSLIDVNIHPNKQKVKIKIIDEILNNIKEEFSSQLKRGIEIPNAEVKQRMTKIRELAKDKSISPEKEIIERVYGERKPLDKETYNLFSPKTIFKNEEKIETIVDDNTIFPEDQQSNQFEKTQEYKVSEKEDYYHSQQIDFYKDQAEETVEKEPFFPKVEKSTILGILFNTYILFQEEGKENLYLLDQHAAHERILYEEFTEKYKKDSIFSQQLVSPIIMAMKDDELRAFEENNDLFEDLGYELDLFDESHIVLRSCPVILGNIEGEKLLLEIFDNISKEGGNKDSIRDRIIMKSCKAAVKAGDHLSEIEVKALLKQLREAEYPFTCPHGRPTLIQIKKSDIEKMFSRIK